MLSVFRNRNEQKDVAQLGLIGLFTCLLHPTKQGFELQHTHKHEELLRLYTLVQGMNLA